MGFAGRGNEKDRQLRMGMSFAVRTEWEWQNTEWGSLPFTVLIGSRDLHQEGAGGQHRQGRQGGHWTPTTQTTQTRSPSFAMGIRERGKESACIRMGGRDAWTVRKGRGGLEKGRDIRVASRALTENFGLDSILYPEILWSCQNQGFKYHGLKESAKHILVSRPWNGKENTASPNSILRYHSIFLGLGKYSLSKQDLSC